MFHFFEPLMADFSQYFYQVGSSYKKPVTKLPGQFCHLDAGEVFQSNRLFGAFVTYPATRGTERPLLRSG
jgi:hypothetical protein